MRWWQALLYCLFVAVLHPCSWLSSETGSIVVLFLFAFSLASVEGVESLLNDELYYSSFICHDDSDFLDNFVVDGAAR